MSLVSGFSYKDEFAVLAGDTKGKWRAHSLDANGQVTGSTPMNRKDGVIEKVTKVTDYVLMGHVGINIIADKCETELKRRTKPSDDLRACTDILKEIIRELRTAAKEDVDPEVWPFIKCLDTDTEPFFFSVLTGFYDNGNTGVSTFSDGTLEISGFDEQEMTPDLDALASFVRGIGDEIEDDDPFNIGDKEPSLDNYLRQLSLIHACVSFENQDSVSSECQLHVLTKPPVIGDPPEYERRDFDTAQYYEHFSKLRGD